MAANSGYIITKIYENINTEEENVIYFIIDIASNNVHSRYLDVNVAYQCCYELNFPPITEYKISQKIKDGIENLELEELPQTYNYSIDHAEILSKDDKNKIEISMLENLQIKGRKLKV